MLWFKKKQSGNPRQPLLTVDDIILNAAVPDKWTAIRLVGQRLVAAGRVSPEYVEAMIRREHELSTYVGNGLAIPHGVNNSRQYIHASGLSVAQFPAGVDFGDGQVAYLVVGIAGRDEEHVALLARIAERCQDEAEVRRLAQVTTREEILRAFA